MNNLFLLFLVPLFFPVSARAAAWYYPLSDFSGRQSLKTFGEYINKQFYVGKENIFPNQFIGYHAAIDLEIFPDELNKLVPVYAVGDGKIVYAAPVSGYGGLILEQLSGTGDTALYGHVKLTNLPFKVGDSVSAGSRLTYLGDAFSSQTGGERKHLHFGIYKGTDLYFRGYEPTLTALNSRWLHPTTFLKDHGAVDISAPTPTRSPAPVTVTITPHQIAASPSGSFLSQFLLRILRFFTSLFRS